MVEPSESKEKCTEKEFDATLKKCDAERVDVVSGGEEQPVGQEDFVQQLAKQEAVPKASEQNFSEEDDAIFSNKKVDDEFKANLARLSQFEEVVSNLPKDRLSNLPKDKLSTAKLRLRDTLELCERMRNMQKDDASKAKKKNWSDGSSSDDSSDDDSSDEG